MLNADTDLGHLFIVMTIQYKFSHLAKQCNMILALFTSSAHYLLLADSANQELQAILLPNDMVD